MDVLKTFLRLTDYTYTNGDEHLLKDRLPKNVKEDKIGNYYLEIGESETMFCAHLDTAAYKKEKVKHDIFKSKQGDTGVGTDEKTILGADDKAGVVIMLYLIKHNIPGLYYFFVGEESGLIGSRGALKEYTDFFSKYKRCIAFDRRDYGSVITKQMGSTCCSPVFAEALIKELGNNGMIYKKDPTGVYTDSAVFMSVIPECTNLSVGYFNEHTRHELQNITYLEELCKASVKVNWEKLPTERKSVIEDSPTPKRGPKKSNDLSDDELIEIFFKLDESIENILQMYCFNFNSFIPEKEMIYVDYQDDQTRMSIFVHEDGSITANENKFLNLEDFEYTLKFYYGQHDDDEDDEESKYYTPSDTHIPFEDDENDENDTNPLVNNREIKEEEFSTITDNFEDDIGMSDLINDFVNKAIDKNKNHLSAKEVNTILEKYNRTIETFIIWVYQTGQGDFNPYGLKWNSDNNTLVIAGI